MPKGSSDRHRVQPVNSRLRIVSDLAVGCGLSRTSSVVPDTRVALSVPVALFITVAIALGSAGSPAARGRPESSNPNDEI
jgi:hypothetical protein